MEVEQEVAPRIHCVAFNQEEDLFAVGTDSGFAVFNTDPVSLQFERTLNGGIGLVQLLYRSNIMVLVGGGLNPKYPLNKVMLWDDKRQRVTGEVTFRSEVKAVRIRPKHLVVALENRIFIYELAGMRLLYSLDSDVNPRGLLALNTDLNAPALLAFPAEHPGQVGLYDCDSEHTMHVQAYQNGAVGYLSLDATGSLLAVSSDKGTRIRIFHVGTQQLLQELRRGSEHAQINQLAFQSHGPYLSCSSDSGTVHIFIVKSLQEGEPSAAKQSVNNKSSNFSFMKKIIPYFSSEWSFAKLRLNNKKNVVVSFQARPGEKLKDGLLVLGLENLSVQAAFDPYKPGDCQILSKGNIF